ncbi:MAG: hypothetical protein KDC34_01715 [Saprospiraceae bacterium]|nr:hypothetical protein [Saprospiraceae bacterium]
MHNFWSSVFCGFFLLLAGQLIAQPKDNSPYSRLGLGDPVPQAYSANLGMAGLSAAFNNPYHLNLRNPASLGFLQTTSFEAGLYAKYASLDGGNDGSAGVWSGNLQYLALGFPMSNPINQALERKKKTFNWSMAIALQPYTSVGYDIQTTDVVPAFDTTINIFEGTGGSSRLVWANGFRYKELSLGFSAGYLFGKITNSRRVFFQDLGIAYQDDFEDEISIRAWTLDLGAQYRLWLKKAEETPTRGDKSITFGIFGNLAQSFKTNSSKLYVGVNGSYPDLDTLVIENDVEGSGVLPSTINFGLMYESFQKLKLGVDVNLENWSAYENDAKPEVLSNTYRIAIGGEYIPDITSYNSYAKKMRYRFGGFYGTDARSFNSTLTSYGVTLGVGLPVILQRGQTSFVNLALEAGQFGSAEFIRETYVKMTLGFTLNDNSWFYKRKFD